jgi:hypothetical protein
MRELSNTKICKPPEIVPISTNSQSTRLSARQQHLIAALTAWSAVGAKAYISVSCIQVNVSFADRPIICI